MRHETIRVIGMSCGHCVHAVEKALSDIGASGRADLNGGTVAVDYDESKLTMDAITNAIEDLGYDVALPD